MNRFGHGVDLTGRRVIYAVKYMATHGNHSVPMARRTAESVPLAERIFVAESGPGCLGSNNQDGSFDGTRRAITGFWEIDKQKETIDSYNLEGYYNRAGNIVRAPEEEVEIDMEPVLFVGTKKPAPAPPVEMPTTTAGVVAPPVVEAPAPAVGTFDPARVIELFKQGVKVADIAVAMGYERGQGCNRTKAVLKKAGLA